MDEIAEAAFARQFAYLVKYGKRPVNVHLLKRGIEHDNKGYIITPPYWDYVVRYPDNVAVFYTVDVSTRRAHLDGWAWHHEVRSRAKRVGDEGGHMVWGSKQEFPHSVESLPRPPFRQHASEPPLVVARPELPKAEPIVVTPSRTRPKPASTQLGLFG